MRAIAWKMWTSGGRPAGLVWQALAIGAKDSTCSPARGIGDAKWHCHGASTAGTRRWCAWGVAVLLDPSRCGSRIESTAASPQDARRRPPGPGQAWAPQAGADGPMAGPVPLERASLSGRTVASTPGLAAKDKQWATQSVDETAALPRYISDTVRMLHGAQHPKRPVIPQRSPSLLLKHGLTPCRHALRLLRLTTRLLLLYHPIVRALPGRDAQHHASLQLLVQSGLGPRQSSPGLPTTAFLIGRSHGCLQSVAATDCGLTCSARRPADAAQHKLVVQPLQFQLSVC